MQEESLYSLIKTTVEDMGYVALETVLLRSKNKHTLRVVIYHREKPIGAEDCTDVAEVLSRRLDIDDPIDKRYDLMVESPGLEHEIKHNSEYPYFVGKEFKVFPLAQEEPALKEGFFIGVLESCEGGVCSFLSEGAKYELRYEGIRKARLYFDFQKALKKPRLES